jgi:Tol biopolymer transport system component
MVRFRWCAALGLALMATLAPLAAGTVHDPREVHLADVRQLTFGGENAEAYFSPDGKQLIFQSTRPPYACDQIFTMAVHPPGAPQLVSTGTGRTTCAYFSYPAADHILYASTHHAGAACPPPPDRSHGYVWAIYGEYELYAAQPDGSTPRRLTDNDAYDAEATVCARDGSVVFTSTRDGDLELYRMDADGSNVRRLTNSPGYDGGAFFSSDCSQLVWRASRPRDATELDAYRQLLADDKVRPSRMEIMVADGDGANARQVTYLGAASFAPFFFPSGRRIIFSSNTGDPRGREFDLYAINTDGSALERITYTPGFDGFPMFSPDGSELVFGSNRNQGKAGETDLYLARFVVGTAVVAEESAADRFAADVRWLADDAREGRGIGTAGLVAAASYLEERMRALGLEPAGEAGTFRQRFEVPTSVTATSATALAVGATQVERTAFEPASFSASATVAGATLDAGYGISAAELGHDDYAGLDARGKVVLVRRFVPPGEAFAADEPARRYGDLRYKAWNAREHGAVGLLIADLPKVGAAEPLPEEAPLPTLRVEARGDAGLPVLMLKRDAFASLLATGGQARLTVALEQKTSPAWNVVGRIAAGAGDAATRLPGAVLLGAHYDHLGSGGSGSLTPGESLPHNGADDNASGTAALLEAARVLLERRSELRRDVILVAFSGEESGILGSTAFTRLPPPGSAPADLVAMINMDMVGRLREGRLTVLGSDSANEWKEIVPPLCATLGLDCALGGDGYGPSDQTPFYAAGVPVLHLFTGTHDDYHKPSDDAERINAAGGARVGTLAADLALAAANRVAKPTYQSVPSPLPQGDPRSYGASLGTVPDYAGPADGRPGVLLAGVRPGGPAEKAGLRRGDLLVMLGGHAIGDINDMMFALRAAKPGERAVAVVERDGARLELPVVFGTSTRMR